MKSKVAAILAGLLSTASLYAGELAFNSTFDLKEAGYVLNWYIEPDRNSELTFHPLEFLREEGISFGRIRNPFGEFFELHGREFLLRKGEKYLVTLRARSNRAGHPLRVICYAVPERTYYVYSKIFPLEQEWKEFCFEVIPQVTANFHFQLCPGLHCNPDVPEKAQVDIAKLSICDNQPDPVEQVECAVSPLRSVWFADRESRIDFSIQLKNYSAAAVERTITIRAMGEYPRSVLFSRTFPIRLAAGEVSSFTWQEAVDRFGFFRLEVSGAERWSGGAFNRMGQYRRKEIDVTKQFCIGGNGGAGFLRPPKVATPAFVTRGVPVGRELELLAQAGFRLLREHDSGDSTVCWPLVQPFRDRWDFRVGERILEMYRRYGLVHMPVFGNYEFVRPFRSWDGKKQPDWLLEQCGTSAWDRGWNAKQVLEIPLDLWRDYIRRCVTRYKGALKLCEILNEPNLHMTPQDYMVYLRAAYEEIKKVDPSIVVNGMGISSDFGAQDQAEWEKASKQLKMFDFIDSMGFHPYSARTLNSPFPADQEIAGLKRWLAGGSNRTIPLWNTECYYLADENPAPGDRIAPHHAVQRFLTDLGEGVALSCPVHTRQLFARVLMPENRELHETIPGPVLTACNRLAILLEGAAPAGKRKFSPGVVAYRYTARDGSPIGAVWRFGRGNGIFADLGRFTVLDMFGNPVPETETRKLEITGFPFYLLPKTEDFVTAFAALELMLETPVVSAPLVRIAGGTLYARLSNDSPEEITGYAGFTGGGYSADGVTAWRLPPHSVRTLAMPVYRSSEFDGKAAQLRLHYRHRNFLFPVSAAPVRELPVDRDIAFASGDGKVQATMRVFRTPEGVNVRLRVRDLTDGGGQGARNMWDCDSVELFLDSAPAEFNAKHPKTYDSRVSRLFFLPREKGEKQFAIWSTSLRPEELKYQVKPVPSGYELSLTLPEEQLLDSNQRFGFDCKVNDAENDREKAVRSARLGTHSTPFNDRTAFEMVRFSGNRL